MLDKVSLTILITCTYKMNICLLSLSNLKLYGSSSTYKSKWKNSDMPIFNNIYIYLSKFLFLCRCTYSYIFVYFILFRIFYTNVPNVKEINIYFINKVEKLFM